MSTAPGTIRLRPGVFLLGLAGVLLLAGASLGSEAGGHGGVDSARVSDFIWRTVNFLVFAAILVKLLAKPAKNFFAKRTQDISQSLEDLEAKKAAARQALKEAEARLALVKEEWEQILEQYRAEGEAEKARILEKAEVVAQRLKDMAALTIDQETKKAVQDLKKELVDQATRLAEELLARKVTSADQQQLVEEYLKKVVQVH